MNIIDIGLYADSEKFSLEAEGHACYGPYGEDIVCAAVSILCDTLKKRCRELEYEGEAEIINEESSVGLQRLEVKAAPGSAAREAFNTVAAGLDMLEYSYPRYVCVGY